MSAGPASSYSDERLVAACLAGDAAAWDVFVERFAKLIYWAIHRTLERSRFKQRTDWVDDIFQEVFAELFERETLAKLRDAKNLRRFLVVMAGYRASNHLRAGGGTELPLEAIEHEPAAAEAPDEETARVVSGAVRELEPKERFCVELHYEQGCSHGRIAELLGVSRDTVSSVLKRSHEKLEQKLKQRGLDRG